jgi:hypothetical protein
MLLGTLVCPCCPPLKRFATPEQLVQHGQAKHPEKYDYFAPPFWRWVALPPDPAPLPCLLALWHVLTRAG